MSGMLVIGVDPGISGAVGVLNPDGSFHSVFDLPIHIHNSLKWVSSRELTSALLGATDGKPARVVIEQASSRPAQGVASSFAFGVTFGSILATIEARHVPFEFVSPSAWKTALRLGRDKKAALHRARELFPLADLSLERHHNRAESLLIALHGMRHLPMPTLSRAAA